MCANSWDKLRQFLFKWLFCFLGGITFGDWLRMLRRNRWDVDVLFWPRALLITLGSVSNSLSRWREDRRHGAAVAGRKILPPLFILGHWRTGTTHLHNLLAVDSHFAFPNAYQVCYPHTFLTTEAAGSRFGFLLPDRRLQDNVRLGMAEPQEDEFALCIATGLSPYMGWIFRRREEFYDRYLTLRGIPADELAQWKSAFTYFLKKFTLKYGRPLLLKSPPHTCRIKLLLELFPDARFVHIHRNPYTVFQSMQRLYETAVPSMRLQLSDDGHLDARILRTYRVMYEAFLAERSLIPQGQFHEVGFESLEKDPLGQLRKLYEALQLPGFDVVEPAVRRYLGSLAGYQKNAYAELTPDLRQRIAREWGRYFEELDYVISS